MDANSRYDVTIELRVRDRANPDQGWAETLQQYHNQDGAQIALTQYVGIRALNEAYSALGIIGAKAAGVPVPYVPPELAPVVQRLAGELAAVAAKK